MTFLLGFDLAGNQILVNIVLCLSWPGMTHEIIPILVYSGSASTEGGMI